jgi:hypothetical protein
MNGYRNQHIVGVCVDKIIKLTIVVKESLLFL